MEEPIFNFDEIQRSLNNHYKFLQEDFTRYQLLQTKREELYAIKFKQILEYQKGMDSWCKEMVKFLKRCGFYGFPEDGPVKYEVPSYDNINNEKLFSEVHKSIAIVADNNLDQKSTKLNDSTHLRHIGLEYTSVRPLIDIGIKTWSDLKSMSYQELFAVPRFGNMRTRRIIEFLKDHGVTLVGVKDAQS